MSGPPRPRCIRHGKNDCDQCRGNSRRIFGEEFSPEYFDRPTPPTDATRS